MNINFNYELLFCFLRNRSINGCPTKMEIINSVSKTLTRTVYPDGWGWK